MFSDIIMTAKVRATSVLLFLSLAAATAGGNRSNYSAGSDSKKDSPAPPEAVGNGSEQPQQRDGPDFSGGSPLQHSTTFLHRTRRAADRQKRLQPSTKSIFALRRKSRKPVHQHQFQNSARNPNENKQIVAGVVKRSRATVTKLGLIAAFSLNSQPSQNKSDVDSTQFPISGIKSQFDKDKKQQQIFFPGEQDRTGSNQNARLPPAHPIHEGQSMPLLPNTIQMQTVINVTELPPPAQQQQTGPLATTLQLPPPAQQQQTGPLATTLQLPNQLPITSIAANLSDTLEAFQLPQISTSLKITQIHGRFPLAPTGSKKRITGISVLVGGPLTPRDPDELLMTLPVQ